ncbi:MAG TPA: signal peptidase I [Vicinamibacterales bacterium]|nr:signal peptidase I [Vicinamibacterales bacterium]
MSRKKSVAREYGESLLIAVVLALFVRTFVFQAFEIPTGSMEPNLLVGDHLIVNKALFAPAATGLERLLLPSRPVRRGDIVVFKFPKEPDRDFIKRVIGLPGERLELRRKRIHINGEPLEEPWAHLLEPPAPEGARPDDLRETYGPVTIPSRQYFVMGDNRDNSEDSRYWGFLPASYIKGQALFIYYSSDDANGGLLGGTRWSRFFNRVR